MSSKYEAVIVLAGGVNSDLTLPPIPKSRVDAGTRLFRDGVTDFLVFSGHFSYLFPNPMDLSESEAMRRYAISQNVPPDAIIVENESKDTLGNAYFTKVRVVIPRKWTKLAVVTSDSHVPRARFIFEKVYGPTYTLDFISVPTPVGADDSKRRNESEKRQLALVREWLGPVEAGDHESVRQFLFTKHPGYAQTPEISVKQLRQKLGIENK